jgi:hypothetical protein
LLVVLLLLLSSQSDEDDDELETPNESDEAVDETAEGLHGSLFFRGLPVVSSVSAAGGVLDLAVTVSVGSLLIIGFFSLISVYSVYFFLISGLLNCHSLNYFSLLFYF